MDLLEAFELHSPAGIAASLAAGASPVALIDGERPVDILIGMYTRSAKFAECLRMLLDAGATTGDPLLEAVLLDDAMALGRILATSPADLKRKLQPQCAYTSCEGVSALHLCAEFKSVRCADALIQAGADIDARADIDAQGMGGQTPLFHAVNSNQNYCRPVMEVLVDAGADLEIRLKALVWGKGCQWETVLFDVTLFSYTQCGLYRQFHRREADIYGNLAYLYKKRYGAEAPVTNVPNKYLAS
jgi:ankyrin repeat protein